LSKGLGKVIIFTMHPEEITLKWLGAGGFEIALGDKVVLVDPFLSRPFDAQPTFSITRQQFKNFNLLVCTHARFEHFADAPYLAATVDAPVYMPRCGRKDIKRAWRSLHRSARNGNPDKWFPLEETGRIRIGELTATPLKTVREGFDASGAWNMLRRTAGYSPRSEGLKRSLAYAAAHPYGPSYAMHMDFNHRGSRMLFFGSLPKHVFRVTPVTGRVDVLAVPFVSDDRRQMKEIARLVERFQPRAILAHHFDLWLPPVSGKPDVNQWRARFEARFPHTPVYFPDPLKNFTLEDVLGDK